MSLKAKQQISGKSYSYKWKPSLFSVICFVAGGLFLVLLSLTYLSQHPHLNPIITGALGMTLIGSGLYSWQSEAHIHFDGESGVFNQRFYFLGKLRKETTLPFHALRDVSIIVKPNRRVRRSLLFKSYVIALSSREQTIPLYGVTFWPKNHRARRDAIAEVLGLP